MMMMMMMIIIIIISQGAIGSEQAGWKTARWIVPNSVAERQTPSVGCHGGKHANRVIC